MALWSVPELRVLSYAPADSAMEFSTPAPVLGLIELDVYRLQGQWVLCFWASLSIVVCLLYLAVFWPLVHFLRRLEMVGIATG